MSDFRDLQIDEFKRNVRSFIRALDSELDGNKAPDISTQEVDASSRGETFIMRGVIE